MQLPLRDEHFKESGIVVASALNPSEIGIHKEFKCEI